MKLWPHQQRALEQLNLASRYHRNTCLTSPTGGGKTRIMFEHLLSQECDCAVYTDRRMLMEQLAEGLKKRHIGFGIRAAGHEPDLSKPVQLCMVQTEVSRSIKGPTDVHPARVIYIDELHKNKGAMMQTLLDEHRQRVEEPLVIGFTATPLGISHMADCLVVAGNNSELRQCGALLPAKHYAPDEPDTKWIGKVKIDEGECGIPSSKRQEFAHRVFGRVVEHYHEFNPHQRPAILFAPGVSESIWFAEQLTYQGIPAAHIDGDNVWLDGIEYKNNPELREEIARRSEAGEIKIVCNRFVLREGIDWPWIYHGIFATVFGSTTSYLQAGGRILRNHPSLPGHVVIQDHGGNWHRFGSLNSDREWNLVYTDSIVAGLRLNRIRNRQEPEPITCPQCHMVRSSGSVCPECGYFAHHKRRLVLQKDGSLREAKGDIYRPRRFLTPTESLKREWTARVKAVKRSKKPTVRNMTFAQLEASFARDHNWKYPPRSFPMMPVSEVDWYRPIREVQVLT